MGDQIIGVQSLHDYDDRTFDLLVETAAQGVIEPFVHALASCVRQCFISFQRVVDHDDVCATTRKSTSDRRREPEATLCGFEISYGVSFARNSGVEQGLIKCTAHEATRLSGQSIGKILGVRDACHLLLRKVSQEPGRERDGCGVRFQVPRRNIDDQTFATAVGNIFEGSSN